MKKSIVRILIATLLLPAICFAKPAQAQASDCHSSQFKDKASIDLFIRKNPKSPKLPQAIFCLGEVSRKQFAKSKDKTTLKTALTAYEKVARKYSSSGLAAEALLLLGDLRRNGLHDEIAARAAYFEVIDRYPKSAAQAKKRLSPGKSESAKPVLVAPTPVAELPKKESSISAPAKNILIETPKAKVVPTLSPAKQEFQKPVVSSEVINLKNTELSDALPPGSGKELVLDESSPPKRPLIVIDPGHGGEDHGAKGIDGLLEKNVVLDISKELEQLLKDRLRAKTFLTRSTDIFIPLAERTKLANDRNADLFVSIHANASEYKTAQGIETYYLDNTNEKSSLKLADRENASLNFGPKQNSDLGFIFSDLIQNVKLDDSISLAHQLQNSLTQTLSRYYQGVNNLGVKKAPFYVLVGAHMPCVLAEISFIDHPLEGRRLGEERYQKLIAQSIYEGIRKFFIKREVK